MIFERDYVLCPDCGEVYERTQTHHCDLNKLHSDMIRNSTVECKKCGRLCEEAWSFCAWCGKELPR